MSAQQHTPTPWIVHIDSKESEWPLIMAGSPSGRIVANVNPESCPDTSSAPAFVRMPAKANADFIVLACNSHDALKDVVAGLIDEADRCGLKVSPELLSAAREAFAKAEVTS